jgi:2-epi-5-epi-valiolone synthase
MSYAQELFSTHVESVDSTWVVQASQPVKYQVTIVRDLFQPGNTCLLDGCVDTPLQTGDRRLIVIDENVHRIYGSRIQKFFDEHGIFVSFAPMRADETVKQWNSVAQVIDAMNMFEIGRRHEPLIAIGGGVLLDIAGFAASVYRRGTPFVRIPTTLLGLVDAGVGVKTGVNYGRAKNRIGTYTPAAATFIDRDFIASLDDRHISNGLAEILKMALVKSEALFGLLEKYGNALISDHFQGTTPALDSAADRILSNAIGLMLEELQPDLWESHLQRCVDYGHTFSPTIEMEALPTLLHGEAVCIDMAFSSTLSLLRGDVTRHQYQRILSLMQGLGLPAWDPLLARPSLLQDALADATRHRGGKQRLPLPRGIGAHYFANDVTAEELQDARHVLEQSVCQLISADGNARNPIDEAMNTTVYPRCAR